MTFTADVSVGKKYKTWRWSGICYFLSADLLLGDPLPAVFATGVGDVEDVGKEIGT